MFNAFQKFDETESAEDVQVGTPENPLYLGSRAKPVPTGANAQRSQADRWKNFIAGDKKDKEAFFPASTRAAKRADQRARRTQQRKHQRGYFRRELARENAARDLLNLINIADRKVLASPRMRGRAVAALAARVAYLHGEQQKAYDKALAARQADRSLPAPTPPLRHDAIEAQLRELAKTATLPTPKVRRERPTLQEVVESELRTRHIDFIHGDALTTGRAG